MGVDPSENSQNILQGYQGFGLIFDKSSEMIFLSLLAIFWVTSSLAKICSILKPNHHVKISLNKSLMHTVVTKN